LNFKTVIFTALFIFFSGCVGQKNVPEASKGIPSWYLSPTPNSNTYLYGVGEGKNMQEAKNSALNDMASRLSVNIDSTINQNKQSISSSKINSYEKKLTQNINVEVKKINFTNAAIESSEVIGNSFFLLMRVNKEELFNNHLESFSLHQTQISNTLKANQKRPVLEQLYTLEKLLPTVEKATSQALILNAINKEFNSSTPIEKHHQVTLQYEELKESLAFKISTNLPQKPFALQLIETLNKAGYKAVDKEFNAEIKLNNTVNYSVAMGWHIAKVSTSVMVVSAGKIVSNSVINSVGRSSSSKENALISASLFFKNELDKKGVDALLFPQ